MHGPGTLLGSRYRLAERIGGGRVGVVWRATDEVTGRTVAAKVPGSAAAGDADSTDTRATLDPDPPYP